MLDVRRLLVLQRSYETNSHRNDPGVPTDAVAPVVALLQVRTHLFQVLRRGNTETRQPTRAVARHKATPQVPAVSPGRV